MAKRRKAKTIEDKKAEIVGRKDEKFRDMCLWVETELLGYDGIDQKIQKAGALALIGLQKGQAVANNNCEQYGSYPIDVIFATFKINKFVIKNAIKNKKFDGELQKINYICAIVRNDLNDVYTRMRNAEMSKKKSEKANTEVQVNEVAEYQRQSEDINESMSETFYTYDPQRRRLQNLTVNSGGNTIMDNAYTYDAVSNVQDHL